MQISLFRLGKNNAILSNLEEAKKLVRQAIEKDAMCKLEYIEDSAFYEFWGSY